MDQIFVVEIYLKLICDELQIIIFPRGPIHTLLRGNGLSAENRCILVERCVCLESLFIRLYLFVVRL